MEFFSALALVLLTMVGYSAAAVLVGRGKKVVPGLLDLVLVVALWTIALSFREVLGRWLSILVWLIMSGMTNALITTLRWRGQPDERSEQTVADNGQVGLLERLWEGWKRFAAEMGNYQGRMLMAFFYFLVVTPFGLLVRLSSDPLRLRQPSSQTFWIKRSTSDADLEQARREF